MLVLNSDVDESQSVSILAAVSPRSEDIEDDPINDQFLTAVTYESVSSVMRQFDKQKGEKSLHGNYASTHKQFQQRSFSRSAQGSRINPTFKYPCTVCGKYGHWTNEHLEYGSLPPGVHFFNKPNGGSMFND